MAKSKSQNDTRKTTLRVKRKKNNKKEIPIFLGVCHKVLYRFNGLVQDLYGVTDYLAMHFFPSSLEGFHLLFVWPKELFGYEEPLGVIVRERGTGQWAKHDISTYFEAIEKPTMLVDPSVGLKANKWDPNTKQYRSILMPISEESSIKIISVPCHPVSKFIYTNSNSVSPYKTISIMIKGGNLSYR